MAFISAPNVVIEFRIYSWHSEMVSRRTLFTLLDRIYQHYWNICSYVPCWLRTFWFFFCSCWYRRNTIYTCVSCCLTTKWSPASDEDLICRPNLFYIVLYASLRLNHFTIYEASPNYEVSLMAFHVQGLLWTVLAFVIVTKHV